MSASSASEKGTPRDEETATAALVPVIDHPTKLAVLEALARGNTLVDAARASGVTARTVRKWRAADDEFSAQIARVMAEARQEVVSGAVETLRAALDDADPRIRVAASAELLRYEKTHAGKSEAHRGTGGRNDPAVKAAVEVILSNPEALSAALDLEEIIRKALVSETPEIQFGPSDYASAADDAA